MSNFLTFKSALRFIKGGGTYKRADSRAKRKRAIQTKIRNECETIKDDKEEIIE